MVSVRVEQRKWSSDFKLFKVKTDVIIKVHINKDSTFSVFS